MGNNEFIVNKSGLDLETIFNKFGKAPVAEAFAENNFSCAEPTFKVGEDGHLFGGDMSAFERLKQISQAREENNASVLVGDFATEPCCQ